MLTICHSSADFNYLNIKMTDDLICWELQKISEELIKSKV